MDPCIPRTRSQRCSCILQQPPFLLLPFPWKDKENLWVASLCKHRSRCRTLQPPNQAGLEGTSWKSAVVEGAWIVLGPQELLGHAQPHHCHKHSPGSQDVPPHPCQLLSARAHLGKHKSSVRCCCSTNGLLGSKGKRFFLLDGNYFN